MMGQRETHLPRTPRKYYSATNYLHPLNTTTTTTTTAHTMLKRSSDDLDHVPVAADQSDPTPDSTPKTTKKQLPNLLVLSQSGLVLAFDQPPHQPRGYLFPRERVGQEKQASGTQGAPGDPLAPNPTTRPLRCPLRREPPEILQYQVRS